MNVIKVNGKTISVPDGANVSVINNVVFINGKLVDDNIVGKNEVIVKLVIEGKLDSLKTDANVECENVGGNVEASGNVACGNVTGSVKAGGNIAAGKVGGNAKAGGNLICGR